MTSNGTYARLCWYVHPLTGKPTSKVIVISSEDFVTGRVVTVGELLVLGPQGTMVGVGQMYRNRKTLAKVMRLEGFDPEI